MKVLHSFSAFRKEKKKEFVITIGVFDGLHLGHRFILKRVIKKARRKGILSLLITFSHHPQNILKKANIFYISDLEERIKILKEMGLNYLLVLKSNSRLLNLSAENFIKKIQECAHIREIIVGDDFRFGRLGEKDINYLRQLSCHYNFSLVVVKKQKLFGKKISSSLIRNYILKGDFKRAEKLLGRKFIVKAEVTKGRGVGRKIGFPTANLFTGDYIMPEEGVYAAEVYLGKNKYYAAVNIGKRPTLSRNKKNIAEAHIINFNKNIMGKVLKLHFIKKIREEKKFSSLEELRKAIARDIRYVIREVPKGQVLTG